MPLPTDIEGKMLPQRAYSSTRLPFSDTYRPSKNYIEHCQRGTITEFVRSCEGYIYLPDILVSYSADLLDVGGTLRDVLEGVSKQVELILLRRRHLDINTFLHDDPSDDLLADEVSMSPVSTPLLPVQRPRGCWCKTTYRISTSNRPVSLFLSTLTLMGKCA
jgi:hypothetical protein